ncbi:MAG: hypothetical protein EHM40_13730 [Chloroflexi bacterium]|nr:MAG: hypothetical protein EHM40_13730 [Chloroflexota bacterium]
MELIEQPQLARVDQILALPTLVRKIIGDLSNTERVPIGLDLRPRTQTASKGCLYA